jgi:hypothetical protein
MSNSSVPDNQEQVLKTAKSKKAPDMIKRELEYFAQSINNHALQLRTHSDNFETLEVAHAIIDKLNITKR